LNAQYLNSQSRSTRRRQVVLAGRIAGLLPVALVAGPARAQERDTVVTRVVSTWQTDVDRLRQDLLSQQRRESQLFRMLTEIELKKKVAVPDSQAKLMAQSQLLFNQMRESSIEQANIKRRLESLCLAVKKPEGWLGVYTTGFQLEDKRADGTKIVRFLEPPVVATVDPGSPAERVGVRAGDVLVEIGGQRVLRGNIIFAELLRPGREIVLKLQRGNELVTLTPIVEPLPEASTRTSCAFVDLAVDYIVAPTPAQGPRMVRVETATGSGGGGKYTYTYEPSRVKAVGIPRVRPDSSIEVVGAPSSSGAFVGPMVGYLGGGANSLAGLQLVALSTESSRAFGVSYGILVNHVMAGTPGRDAGLRGGDILVSADSVDLRSIQHLQRVISRATDRVVTLVIVRDKKRETVQLKW
jgi:membrane-associated protease RseP (regulator of RpoE activity)